MRELATAVSLPDLFRAVARRHADRTALVDADGGTMTYAELDERSDRLARRLAGAGITHGSLVGVLFDRSAATVLALLAVLKAGAAYVPLDPDYPPERLAHVVADTGLRWIVNPAGDAARPGFDDVAMIDVADDGDAPSISELPLGSVDGDRPAYVIYTSGSTGLPKGCVVTHRNVLSLLAAALPLFRVTEADRWALFHSFSFDFSVWELWGALATGACAVSVPPREAFAPAAFVALLARERITVLNQVPSVFRNVVDAYVATGRPRLGLRYLVFGGEALDRQSVRTFLGEAAGDRPTVVNMYGITETTVHVTFKEITEADLVHRAGSPIGVPLPHLSVEVRGEDLEPLPAGTVGELWVSGDGVSAGYLHRPELTAERFVRAEAARGGAAELFYRTGDLGRVLPDGELEHHGRLDRQVKIRGFRIELAEIEAAVHGSGAVSATAVTVVPDGGRQALVAVLIPAADGPDDPTGKVREHLSATLPYYMMPDHYLVMAALPLSPTGKTDTRALVAAAAASHTDAAAAAVDADPGVAAFLAHLRSLRIRVWAEDGRLRYQAPAGAMTGAIRDEVARRRGELLAYFAGHRV